MKDNLEGLSDPTKFHEPISIKDMDHVLLKKMLKSMIH